MEEFVEGLVSVLGVILIICVIAVFGGTIIYWIWPVAIPAAFPGLVASGVLAGKLAWWEAVCLTWLCGILLKSSHINTPKK